MNRVVVGIKRFVEDTVGELKKCSWPSKSELTESTIVVIVAILILTAYIAVLDEVSRFFIKLITMQ